MSDERIPCAGRPLLLQQRLQLLLLLLLLLLRRLGILAPAQDPNWL